MVSKGISLKRKLEHLLLCGKDNSENCSTWVEEFSPTNVKELAIHKKKVSEVQVWIQNATNRENKDCFLILNGPPGVGKTATVKSICKSLDIELFTWSNKQQENAKHIDNDMEDDRCGFRDQITSRETQAQSFSRFLLQSSKYSLCLNDKRIILIEEFPNAFVRDPTLLHCILRRYALHSYIPVIFIISDNAKGESLEGSLFPKDLQFSLNIKNISFNAIAPTMMMKVLTKINNSPKMHSSYKKLSKSEIESIVADSLGDIRNAINSMQFMCMSNFKKPLSMQDSVSSSEDGSKKDSSLFLFHALGKILYSKRDASKKSNHDVLPTHLKIFEKDPLISNPEEVFDKTSISAEAFTLFLQENYITFVDDIEANFECALWLSEADYVSALWNSRDTMNDYMVSLASRGLMFNLSSMNNRRWRALHKPKFYENLSKQRRLQKSLKYAFSGSSLSMRQLQVDLVPYLSKLQLKDLNLAQAALTKELGDMKLKKFFSHEGKTLDEKDHFCFEAEESGAIYEGNDANKSNENVKILPDEEIIIEEYDF